MGIQEQEALARQLQHVFIEAVGYEDKWDKLDPSTREAWIQVAQFVIDGITIKARVLGHHGIIEPTQVVSGYDEPSDLDRELMRREMVEELRRKRSWDQDRFSNYTGIVPRDLRDIDYPDHK